MKIWILVILLKRECDLDNYIPPPLTKHVNPVRENKYLFVCGQIIASYFLHENEVRKGHCAANQANTMQTRSNMDEVLVNLFAIAQSDLLSWYDQTAAQNSTHCRFAAFSQNVWEKDISVWGICSCIELAVWKRISTVYQQLLLHKALGSFCLTRCSDGQKISNELKLRIGLTPYKKCGIMPSSKRISKHTRQNFWLRLYTCIDEGHFVTVCVCVRV